MPWNVKNQFTGRFTLRFRYRYVDQKAASGKSSGLKLMTRLDTIDTVGNRAYYGTAPKAGWTNYGSWETYEYQIIAKSGVAELVYVTLHASLQDASKASADYYLIDDVEVLNEKGECVMSGGTFDNATTIWVVTLISLATIAASTVLLLRHKKKQNEAPSKGKGAELPQSALFL